MTTIIKAAGAAQFLSLVPHLLGFTPTRSLVLVPFSGARSLGAMRFDLPDDADHETVDRIAATCVGMVCRVADAEALTIVVYTDATIGDELPHGELVRALTSRADACGLRVGDALCVAAAAWGSYVDPELPPGGRLLDAVGSVPSEVAEAMPLAEGDQTSGAELPSITDEAVVATARALDALRTAVAAVCGGDRAPDDTEGSGRTADPGATHVGAAKQARARAVGGARDTTDAGDAGRRTPIDPLALDALRRLDDIPETLEAALGWRSASLAPFDAAVLAWILSQPALRDVALVQWCGDLDDGDEALNAQLRWENGQAYPDDIAMRMWGDGERPDADRLVTALDLVRHVAALAPERDRPGPLAVCAWLSWALGRSTHAARYAAQARDIDPEHGLAEIVLSFADIGHLPEWAFRRPAVRREPAARR